CATFHILTPYPATPLFRQMEGEGRLLHRDWTLYDTGHAVSRPKHMSPEELEQGYAWIYERLFSHTSIWARRPEDWRAVPPYLAMSYLYKRSNRFWRLLIKHDLVHSGWRSLVELTRFRHLKGREQLAKAESRKSPAPVVTPGVSAGLGASGRRAPRRRGTSTAASRPSMCRAWSHRFDRFRSCRQRRRRKARSRRSCPERSPPARAASLAATTGLAVR